MSQALATLHKQDLQKKTLEVHHIVCETYECPIAFFSEADPLSQLVSNLLSRGVDVAWTTLLLYSQLACAVQSFPFALMGNHNPINNLEEKR
ncbi:MAG: hypothetical protein ACRCYY_14005 [Trueperaceae bacterium]